MRPDNRPLMPAETPGEARPLRGGIFIGLVLATLAASLSFADSDLGSFVVSDRVKLRAAPNDDADAIATLPAGTEVNVVEELSRGWVRIESFSGRKPPGYLRRAQLRRGKQLSRVSSTRSVGRAPLEVSVVGFKHLGTDTFEAALAVRSRASDVLTIDRVTLVTSGGVVVPGDVFPPAIEQSGSGSDARGAAMQAAQGALPGLMSGLGEGAQAAGGAVGNLPIDSFGSSQSQQGGPRTILGVTLAPGGQTRGSVWFSAADSGGRELWVEYSTAGEGGERVVVPIN